MKEFLVFLEKINVVEQRKKIEEILNHIGKEFPQLKAEIKWNQPMFTDHGTFIIGFSISKGHIGVSPEPIAIRQFEDEIKEAGYSSTQGLFRIRWEDKVDYNLLDKMIIYNIEEKKGTKSFWR